MSYLLIKVGRGEDNDVVLNDPTISKYHLEIFVDVEGNVFLTDLESKFGTKVNGKLINDSIELNPFDEVTIGDQIPFNWKKYVEKDQKNTITVGRSQKNDVILNLPYVSEHHLQLFRDKDGNVFITDLDSVEGTFINGVRLNGIALLNQKDKVKVGAEIFHWTKLYPDLQVIEPITNGKEAIKPEIKSSEKEKVKIKKPWYIEHKDLIIIYGIDLLLILFISWSMK
jgi:pSer/pThr/pTyr-binding forkhead associated (FHA) protein